MKHVTREVNRREKNLRRTTLNNRAKQINNFREILSGGSFWDDYIQKKQTQQKAFDYVNAVLLSFKRKETWRRLRRDFEKMDS